MEKITRKSALETVVKAVSEGTVIPGIAEDKTEEFVEVLKKMIVSLDKKSGSTKSNKTQTQIENEGIKARILEVLTEIGKPVTIKELQAREEFAEYSTSKMSALLGQLWDKGSDSASVVKSYDKRVAYFGIK